MSPNVLNILKNKSDNELTELVKESGDNEAFIEICRRYENIFYKICHRYLNALSMSGIDTKDIFDEKNFIILHCITTFKPEKNCKLSTWIGNYARFLCLNSINARRFILPSNDDDIKNRIEDNQVAQNYLVDNGQENYQYICNLIYKIKDPRIIDIFKLRYFSQNKMIWKKIARKMRISTQTAINLHNKGMSLLKRKIKSKNISDMI